MFESILGAVLAHKQIVIAAIAISGLVVYAFPYNMVAQADHTPITIDRDINIPILPLPCAPYCNIEEPEDIDRVVGNGLVHLQITFSFVPR